MADPAVNKVERPLLFSAQCRARWCFESYDSLTNFLFAEALKVYEQIHVRSN